MYAGSSSGPNTSKNPIQIGSVSILYAVHRLTNKSFIASTEDPFWISLCKNATPEKNFVKFVGRSLTYMCLPNWHTPHETELLIRSSSFGCTSGFEACLSLLESKSRTFISWKKRKLPG